MVFYGAYRRGYFEVIREMVERGIVNSEETEELSSLEDSNLEIVKYLTEKGFRYDREELLKRLDMYINDTWELLISEEGKEMCRRIREYVLSID